MSISVPDRWYRRAQNVRPSVTFSPKNMIGSTVPRTNPDRLSAFLSAFSLDVRVCLGNEPARLVIAGDENERTVCFYPRAVAPSRGDGLVAADVDFGGAANPLLQSLPMELRVSITPMHHLWAMADYFINEAQAPRCGRNAALSRLGELLVLMLLREALDRGAAQGGVLAGLADTRLRYALAEMLREPHRAWNIEELADLCSMSRSHFMRSFKDCVGVSPGAFLGMWRMTLARQHLMRGMRVKEAAARAGYGSAAAFSRAYERNFGEPPRDSRHAP
jgi:AraC-like DNA-binding protein